MPLPLPERSQLVARLQEARIAKKQQQQLLLEGGEAAEAAAAAPLEDGGLTITYPDEVN